MEFPPEENDCMAIVPRGKSTTCVLAHPFFSSIVDFTVCPPYNPIAFEIFNMVYLEQKVIKITLWGASCGILHRLRNQNWLQTTAARCALHTQRHFGWTVYPIAQTLGCRSQCRYGRSTDSCLDFGLNDILLAINYSRLSLSRLRLS